VYETAYWPVLINKVRSPGRGRTVIAHSIPKTTHATAVVGDCQGTGAAWLGRFRPRQNGSLMPGSDPEGYTPHVRPAHLPTAERIAAWADFSPDQPLRILASGCLAGKHCGYDGTSYGEHALVANLFGLPNVQVFNFCPEDFSFRTPRALCNIHGGDGFDALDGRARVTTEDGEDWTDGSTTPPGI
jgi:hypothetical protein